MAEPDRVLKQALAWYKASVSRALTASGLSPGDQAAATTLLWEALGLKNPGAPPANPDLLDFKEHNGAQESLAVAVTIVGEALVALGYVQQAVAAAGGGGLPAALAVVDPVLQQIERLRTLEATARYPSALTIGKILLMLSGDAQANPAASHEADKLASLLGAASAGDVADTQAALGIVALLIGSLIDRSFTAPISGAPTLVKQTLPNFAGKPKLTLKVPAALSASLAGDIEFNVVPPSAIKAGLKLAVNKSKPIDGTNITLALTGTPSVDLLVPVTPPGAVQVSNDYTFGLELTRKKAGGALVISNNTAGVTISIGELGVALQLTNGEPLLRFSAHDAKSDHSAVRRIPEDDSRRRHQRRTRCRRGSRQGGDAALRQRHGPPGQPARADAAHGTVRAPTHQSRAEPGRREFHESRDRGLGVVRRRARTIRRVGRSSRDSREG